jgi:hypothetical protein
MTSETWGTALLVLGAILVGAAVPALVQLRATLRAAEAALTGSLPRVEAALAATTAAAGRIEAVVQGLEEGGRIERLVDGLTALSVVVTQLKESLRVASVIGAAVGPAVSAAVHAFTQARAAPPADGARTAEQLHPVQEGRT